MNIRACFASLLILTVFAGCNSDSGPTLSDSFFNQVTVALKPNFSVGIRTVDANGVETVEFSQGQQIVIEMPISNLLNETQNASAADNGHPAFCIRRATDRDCLWDTRFGRAFPQIVVSFEFQPLETRVFGRVSDQLANDGMAFGPGDYEVKGWFGYDSENDFLGSSWHSFTIVE